MGISITKDGLRQIVKEAVESSVDEQLAPLKKQQTNWFAQITGEAQPSDNARATAPHIRRYKGKDSPFGRAVQALALGGGKQHESYNIAKSNWGSDDPVTKAVSSGDFSGAGALLKDDVADDLTDRLRIRSILRQMGMSSVTAPWGSKDMPVLTSSVTAAFSEEGTEIAASDLAVGRRRLDPKRLGCFSVFSRELLNWSSAGSEGLNIANVLTDDMAKVIAEEETRAILYSGTGLTSEPLSLFNQVKAGQQFTANASVSLSAVTSDLFSVLTRAGNLDVNTDTAWTMTQRSWLYLNSVRDSNGVPGFASNLISHSNPRVGEPVGTLYGQPVWTSNALPNNLGGGSDESIILFFAPEDVWLGDWEGVEIMISEHATYNDGSNQVNLFQRNQAAVRAIRYTDAIAKHDEDLLYLDQVTWEAA